MIQAATWAALAMARLGGDPWVAEGLSTGLDGSSEPAGGLWSLS